MAEDFQKLQEELEQWQKTCKQANNQRTAKRLEKNKAEERQEELENELNALETKKKEIQKHLKEQETHFTDKILDLQMSKSELEEEETELRHKLDESEKTYRTIQNTLLVNSPLPQKNINCKGAATTGKKHSDKEPMDISYTCQIISVSHLVLGGRKALLTFEDEEVARSVISRKKHSLEIEDSRVTVEAMEPPLPKLVKFEVNMNISRKKINITNLPKDMPEEMIKDKVELAFYKSNIGGAEIEKVDYDQDNNTACVTYLQQGVAQRVLRNDYQLLEAGGATCEVEVKPCVNMELNKLQMFSAVSKRSVLLTGFKPADLTEDDVQDIIHIHFQKPSNGGGEVESILFSEDGRKTPIFEEDVK